MLDCNVLISAARTEGTCREVVTRALAGNVVVLSQPVLDEYVKVGDRPKRRTSRPTLRTILDELVGVAALVGQAAVSFGLPDPDDEIYLATALAGGADALVTGNLRHFPQEAYGGVKILSPRMFLERAEAGLNPVPKFRKLSPKPAEVAPARCRGRAPRRSGCNCAGH